MPPLGSANCARHARATTVAITLARQDDLIALDITDNGRGLGTRLTWTARPHH